MIFPSSGCIVVTMTGGKKRGGERNKTVFIIKKKLTFKNISMLHNFLTLDLHDTSVQQQKRQAE